MAKRAMEDDGGDAEAVGDYTAELEPERPGLQSLPHQFVKKEVPVTNRATFHPLKVITAFDSVREYRLYPITYLTQLVINAAGKTDVDALMFDSPMGWATVSGEVQERFRMPPASVDTYAMTVDIQDKKNKDCFHEPVGFHFDRVKEFIIFFF